MGVLRNLFSGARPPASPTRRVQGQLVDVEIVGESGYQDHIRAVARKHHGASFEIVLRPEPENPYDRNAVAVLVEDQRVGYLARQAAADWQPMICAAEAEGFIVAGKAEVFGGSKDKPSLGVFGEVPWPGKGAPPDRWRTGRPSGPAGKEWPRN